MDRSLDEIVAENRVSPPIDLQPWFISTQPDLIAASPPATDNSCRRPSEAHDAEAEAAAAAEEMVVVAAAEAREPESETHTRETV